MSKLKQLWPYGIRATASGANAIGSVFAIAQDPTKNNAFFWLNLYAASVYFLSNAYEAYKVYIKPESLDQATLAVQNIAIDSQNTYVNMVKESKDNARVDLELV